MCRAWFLEEESDLRAKKKALFPKEEGP
jgi:hypothetical protein